MKKLIAQIAKFGVVGIIAFLIDFVITLLMSKLFRAAFGMDATKAALVGAAFGFTISLIVNYILSMKFVFERRDDMDKKKEFVIFLILSLIGMGINELIIKLCMDGIYANWIWLRTVLHENDDLGTAGSKIIATAIVMVYNFISRKIFLEKKDAPVNE